ncbi:MAG: lysylphosphatidylglycerol synthase transmembrane domain-containing protein [Myxococcota bacterium]
MSSRTRRRLWTGVRLVLFAGGVALLVELLSRTDTQEVWQRMREVGWWFAAAFAAFTGLMGFSALAWRQLLEQRGERVPFAYVLAAYWAGESINYLLPAGAPGEVAKGVFLRRHVSHGELAQSLAVYNLLSGGVIFAWVVAAAIASLFLLDVSWLVAVATASLGSIMLAALWLLRRMVRAERLGRWLRVARRLPFPGLDPDGVQAHVRSMDERLQVFRRGHRARFGRMLAYLLVARVMQVAEVWLLLVGLLPDEEVVWLLQVALLVQAATQMVMYVTLFVPGQIGTMEGGSAIIFAILGMSAAVGLAMELLRRARKVLALLVAGLLGLGVKLGPDAALAAEADGG